MAIRVVISLWAGVFLGVWLASILVPILSPGASGAGGFAAFFLLAPLTIALIGVLLFFVLSALINFLFKTDEIQVQQSFGHKLFTFITSLIFLGIALFAAFIGALATPFALGNVIYKYILFCPAQTRVDPDGGIITLNLTHGMICLWGGTVLLTLAGLGLFGLILFFLTYSINKSLKELFIQPVAENQSRAIKKLVIFFIWIVVAFLIAGHFGHMKIGNFTL